MAVLLVGVSLASDVAAQVVTSSYTGNGTGARLIGAGFQPDVVIVKDTASDHGVIRTSTMPAGNSKLMDGGTALVTNRVTSFSSLGFIVGNDNDANGTGKTYHWVAFKQEVGKMKVGSYTGNGGATQAIAGLGFQPNLVFILPAIDKEATFRSSLINETYNFDNSQGDTDWVPSLDANGFTVGTDDRVNKLDAVYHYVAWKQVPGEFNLGPYTGDDVDDRQITAVGFEPEYCYIKVDYGFEAVQRMASIDNSTDETLFFKNASSGPDRIQKFISNGFEIGKDDDVNKAGKPYMWFCWKKRPPTAVRLISFSATRTAEGATLLSWRTGHEIDNLGFHVYRQDGTRRVRVTSAPIAGSGLTVGAGTALAAGHEYRYWDTDVTEAGAAYWLEDLDFSGRRTLHGPFAASQGAAPAGLDAASVSGLLSELRSAAGKHEPAASRPWSRSTFAWQAGGGSADEIQQVIAAKPGVKIGVDAEGWYRATRAQLEAAGLSANADGTLLQLYADGVEQSVIVTGSPWNGIEFYGRPSDTAYSDTRSYWLIVGSSAGRRIQVLDGTGSGTPAAPSFTTTVERRDRAIYFAALHNGDTENWFGPLVNSEGTTQRLTVEGHAGGDGEVRVSLQGVTTTVAHSVRVAVNGVVVGSVAFDDQEAGVGTFTVPGAALLAGANTVLLTALGGDNDMSVIDAVSLSYPRDYVAKGDILWLTAAAGNHVTVSGFVGSARALDVTDPNAPALVLGAAQAGGMAFTVGGSGARRIVALSDAAVSAPASLKANTPSRLSAARNLTWIVIGPADLLAAVTPLVDHRRAQGYRVQAVDVDDVYDEFSFGQKSPAAIQRFLNRATAPGVGTTAVVLLGDATVDPRDYVGGGAGDRVPAAFVPTTLLETASDDWYVDFDGDSVPEAAIGRLPARTPAQAAAMATKIVGYDATPAAGWAKQLMFVAGANDTEADFDAMSSPLGVLVPSGYSVDQVSASTQGTTAAKGALLSGFNTGRLIVNYLGHGSVELWANDLLTRGDVAGMGNGSQLPFVVAMNCLNGYFQGYVQEESLAEALLRAPGGAVAVWGSSTLAPPHAQAGVNAELLRWLFSGVDPTLGQAIVLTKRAVGSTDLRRGWIFFGDPATKLKGLPQTVVPISMTEIPGAGPVPPGGGLPIEPPGGTVTGAPAWPAQSLADFTGDGQADLLLHDAQSGRWQIAVAGVQNAMGPAGHWPSGWRARAIEVTGDRASDVFVADERAGTWALGLNDGRGLFRYTSGYWAPGYTMHVGDFDGDTREDILLYSADSGKWFQALSDGAGGFVYRRGRWSPNWSVTVTNFNGDGLADVLLFSATTGQYFTGINDGVGEFVYRQGQWTKELSVVPLDLDGDRRDDLFLYSKATGDWWTGMSDGLGAFTLGTGRWAPGWELASADFNADAIDDLLVYDPQGGRWMTVLDGVVGQQLYAGGQWLPGLAVSLGDVNGDGRADVFLHHPQTGAWSRQVSLVTGQFDEASGVLPAAWAVVGRPR